MKELYKYGIEDLLDDTEIELDETGTENAFKKRYLDIKTR